MWYNYYNKYKFIKGHMIKIEKRAFTLAEVLITLGIIGVVAAMTIPTLIAEYQKSKIVEKVKHTYTIFSQLVPILNKEQGSFEYIGEANSLADLNVFFIDYIEPNIKINKDCGNTPQDCWFSSTTKDLWTTGTNALQSRTDARYFTLSNGTAAVIYLGSNGELNIFYAINGTNGSNTMGKDVFAMVLAHNKALPRGSNLDSGTLNTYTNSPGTGTGCQYALTRIIRDGWQIKYF